MSKSYKKNIIKYAPTGNYGKKQANRKVRRVDNIPSGKAYKKVYCSWDIHDIIYDGRWDDKEIAVYDYLNRNNIKKINGVYCVYK